MNTVFNKTLLCDGSYFLHRMLSQPNQMALQTTTGKKTGGIFGTIKSLFKEMQKYNYFPIVVFDGGLSPRRLEVYPNYKRNEEKQLLLECKESEKTEQQIIDEAFMREYRTQRKDIITFLHGLGIPCIRIEGWEGDDLLYILSKMSKDSIIISDDKDLIQAVYEDETRRCRIWRTMHEEMWDVNTLKEKEMDAWEYINCKAIVGDPSDNIPSACYGVGEKTASGLYHLIKVCEGIKIPFPRTEEDLDYRCKGIGIPKRKAYMNFDDNQFAVNMELMNLKLVDNDITDDFVNFLHDEVIMEYSLNDLALVGEKIKEFEMYSIDVNGILKRLEKVHNYLEIKNADKITNNSEEAISHLF